MGPLPGVGALVEDQPRGESEGLGADGAAVGLLPGVDPAVLGQGAGLRECLPALLAPVGPLCLGGEHQVPPAPRPAAQPGRHHDRGPRVAPRRTAPPRKRRHGPWSARMRRRRAAVTSRSEVRPPSSRSPGVACPWQPQGRAYSGSEEPP